MTAVYVVSRSRHGGMWQDFRDRHPGYTIVSTWIDEWEQGATEDLADLWTRCVSEVARADALIAYHEPGDTWKGAFIEIGAALAKGIPVIVIGDPPGSWRNHPLVSQATSFTHAVILLARRIPAPTAPEGGACDV